MTSLIRGITGFIVAALLTAFALLNRQNINVAYSPLHDPLSIPLYLIVLSMFALGFLIGGFLVWINGGYTRKLTRQQRHQIKALEKELNQTKEGDAHHPKPPADFFSALPLRLHKR